MESTGIVIKETIRNQNKSRKKISKLSFEEIILKSTLYLFVPHCVPPISGGPDFAIQNLQ